MRRWERVACRSALCLRLFAAEGGRELFRRRDDGIASIKIRGISFVLAAAPALVVCSCGEVWRSPDGAALAHCGIIDEGAADAG